MDLRALLVGLTSAAVPQVPFIADPTLEQILEADRLAREAVRANS